MLLIKNNNLAPTFAANNMEGVRHLALEGADLFFCDMEIRTGVIYKITSPTGKIYIGQTINFKKRLAYYRTLGCKEQTIVYKSILKYGWEAHKFEIIENNVLQNDLDEREKFWISYFDTYRTLHGMNICKGGKGSPGRNINEKTKSRLILFNKGRKQSSETIAKRVLKLKGRKMSEESKQKIRLANTGKKMSLIHKEKLYFINKGRKVSEQTRQKLREANSGKRNGFYGKNHSEQTKLKMRAAKLGKKLSLETRLKMSAALIGNKNGQKKSNYKQLKLQLL